jgi:hypothetical protein
MAGLEGLAVRLPRPEALEEREATELRVGEVAQVVLFGASSRSCWETASSATTRLATAHSAERGALAEREVSGTTARSPELAALVEREDKVVPATLEAMAAASIAPRP